MGALIGCIVQIVTTVITCSPPMRHVLTNKANICGDLTPLTSYCVTRYRYCATKLNSPFRIQMCIPDLKFLTVILGAVLPHTSPNLLAQG